MSFIPFLGGKRICIGKTFAENMMKCILTIFLTKCDFELVKKERRPTLNFHVNEPEVKVIVTKK